MSTALDTGNRGITKFPKRTCTEKPKLLGSPTFPVTVDKSQMLAAAIGSCLSGGTDAPTSAVFPPHAFLGINLSTRLEILAADNWISKLNVALVGL